MSGRLTAVALSALAAVSAGLSPHAPQRPQGVVPSFADFTIETQQSAVGSSWRSVETLYLAGARYRRDLVHEMPGAPARRFISMTSCADRRTVQLYADARLFAVSGLDDWTRYPGQPVLLGAEVLVMIDGVDTGERRHVGPFEARHVRTTITVEPGLGANTEPGTTEIDGWYINPPGLFCRDQFAQGDAWLEAVKPGGRSDRRVYRTKGAARRGYPVEETTRVMTAAGASVNRVDFTRVSEQALDPALFEIPPGYRAALPLPWGGHDPTRPDTLPNRAAVYWTSFTQYVRSIFH